MEAKLSTLWSMLDGAGAGRRKRESMCDLRACHGGNLADLGADHKRRPPLGRWCFVRSSREGGKRCWHVLEYLSGPWLRQSCWGSLRELLLSVSISISMRT